MNEEQYIIFIETILLMVEKEIIDCYLNDSGELVFYNKQSFKGEIPSVYSKLSFAEVKHLILENECI